MPTKKKKKSKPSQNKTDESGKEGAGSRGPYRKEEFERYALFMALPKIERKEFFGFSTDQEFAKKYELNKDTLTDWKLKPELWDARDKYLTHFKKHTAEILGKLAARAAKTGEAFHSLTFMKLVEGYTEKTGLDITSKGKKIDGFKVIIHGANASRTQRDNSIPEKS